MNKQCWQQYYLEHGHDVGISNQSSFFEFCKLITESINQQISTLLSVKNSISLLLTGGRTAQQLYSHWAKINFLTQKNIKYYFGDERCVPPEDINSNYNLAKHTLFIDKQPNDFCIQRIYGEANDYDQESQRYSDLLPQSIDIALFSVGCDGHIASLFPSSMALFETQKKIVFTVGNTPPYKRFTITPQVIKSVKSVFVLASGEQKGQVLAKALSKPNEFSKLPVRLTIGSTWILDNIAFKSFCQHNTSHFYDTVIKHG